MNIRIVAGMVLLLHSHSGAMIRFQDPAGTELGGAARHG
jgi:hypothetical protein